MKASSSAFFKWGLPVGHSGIRLLIVFLFLIPVQSRRRRPPIRKILEIEMDEASKHRELADEHTSRHLKTTLVEPDATYSMEFVPSLIFEGETTELTFELTNTGVDDFSISFFTLDLNQNLPPGVLTADATNQATTTCGSSAFGTSFLFFVSSRSLSPGDSCVITVPVVSTSAIQDLTTLSTTFIVLSTGTALPPISTTLIVAEPFRFSLTLEIEYLPSRIPEGGTSVRIYTIDNRNGNAANTNINFHDTLPVEVEIKKIVSNSCGGTVTALSSGNQVSFSGGSIAANSICDIEVRVAASATVTDAVGIVLSTNQGDAEPSNKATLSVDLPQPPVFFMDFFPNNMAVGSVSELIFTDQNSGSIVPATNLAFTNNHPSDLSVATSPTTNCKYGSVSAENGGASITLTGAQLGGLRECTIRVGVTGSIPGTFTSTSGALISDSGNSGPAAASLEIDNSRVRISMELSPVSVPYGGISRVTYTFENNGPAVNSAVDLEHFLPSGFSIPSFSNAVNGCAPDIQLTGNYIDDLEANNYITFYGGVFDPRAESSRVVARIDLTSKSLCTVSYNIVSNYIGDRTTCTENARIGNGGIGLACATLTGTSRGLNILKEMIANPAIPGSEVVLRYTLLYATQDGSDLDGIAFTEDLSALTDLEAVDVNIATPCGPSSSLSVIGGSLSFTGGSLSGDLCPDPRTRSNSCTFDVTLKIPDNAVLGTYQLVTTNISPQELSPDEPVTTELVVDTPPVLVASFVSSKVKAGDQATLRVTIQNTNADSAATEIVWYSNTGLAIAFGELNIYFGNPCGIGSILSPNSFRRGSFALQLQQGTLGPGLSCTFDIPIQIPEDTSLGLISFPVDEPGKTINQGTVFPRMEASFDAEASVVAGVECGTAATNGVVVDLLGQSSVPIEDDSFQWTGPFSEGNGFLNGNRVGVTLPVGTSTVSLSAAETAVTKDLDVIVALNRPPVADAGPNQNFFSATEVQDVVLDGSASSDPDNDSLGFEWFVNGLNNDIPIQGEVVTIQAPVGLTVVTLKVTDEYGNSSTDTVSILVTPDESNSPSISPTGSPSVSITPSVFPSTSPSESIMPSALPSGNPSLSISPSAPPSTSPSQSNSPSALPSASPSSFPTSSMGPSHQPTFSTEPTFSVSPSIEPTVSNEPSQSIAPSNGPTLSQSPSVSASPSSQPTLSDAPTKSITPSTTPTFCGTSKTMALGKVKKRRKTKSSSHSDLSLCSSESRKMSKAPGDRGSI